MPTYGYRCTSCSHEFERFQKISDPAVTACETCGEAVKKIVYPVGIQFKGSGFYVNDYAKSSPPSESATPATSEKGSESATPAPSPATGTETKTAPATPAPAATPASTPSSS